MACYSSSYYQDYDDDDDCGCEYSSSSYYITPNSATIQDSESYYSDNFHEQHAFAYDPTPLFAAYDAVPSYARIDYRASSTFSEPNSFVYEPPAPYYPAKTRFIVSYSASEFNEPEFDEYDPTPYGGGYDPAATYGKPLPPSDQICYPRSTPDPTALNSDGFSYGSVIAPYGKQDPDENAVKPSSKSKPASPAPSDSQRPQQLGEIGNGQEIPEAKPSEPEEVQAEERTYDQVPHVPSGYGLEAMDLCEGIFGYWPCLSRNGRRPENCGGRVADYGSYYVNQWDRTADYLFGSPYPYADRREDDRGGGFGYGNSTAYAYNNERHYQEQPFYGQIEYVEKNSWPA